MKQVELAKRAGITEGMVSFILSGGAGGRPGMLQKSWRKRPGPTLIYGWNIKSRKC